MNDTRTFTATIPAESLDEVRDKVAKFNKRATRKGMPLVTLDVAPPVTRTVRDWELGIDRLYIENDCSITVPPLAIGDYRLTAVVEPLARNGTTEAIIVAAPGATVPSDYRLDDPWGCDYCGTRRVRSATFLVTETATGKVAKVGRNCLRDFLGHDPADLLTYWRWLDDFTGDDDDENWSGPRGPRDPGYKPDDILRLTARVVARYGWVSKTKAGPGENPTANTVEFLLAGPGGGAKMREEWERVNNECAWTERAEALYNTTLDGIKTINSKPAPGDWEYNIGLLASADFIPPKRVGFLASAVALGWKRVNAPRSERSERVPLVRPEVSEGEKVSVTGTVVYTTVTNGAYGATTLVKLETSEPRSLYVWWASGALTFSRDETVTLTGTVKRVEWDRFANADAATLTRCKVSRAA